jgi:hypothetical protein
MRGDGVFADSAIAAIIFKIKLSALMNFIQKHQILGKVSAFLWRIEYQKKVFHMHMSSFGLTSIPKTLTGLCGDQRQISKKVSFLMTKARCLIFAN